MHNLLFYKRKSNTIGTIVLAISASFNNPHTIVIDLIAYSLTTVSSNPANYSNNGNRLIA